MNITGEIVVSDAVRALKEKIQKLQSILAGLASERDDLKYHICPELEARYAQEIGDRVNRINYQNITILELKRRIEIARAALNREKTVSQQDVDDQIRREYGRFHDRVNEAFKKAEQTKRGQREKEERKRQYEKKWQERYGGTRGSESEEDSSGGSFCGRKDASGDENAGTGGSGQDASGAGGPKAHVPDIKELYRKIVKKLHPDVNPHVTERKKELFSRAVKAYEDGDIVTLQEIYDEVFGEESMEADGKELSCEELLARKEKLMGRIERLRAEIAAIKETFPYREKEFLDHPDEVRNRRDTLDEEIRRNEETIERLTQLLEEISREMETLRKKQV